MILNLASSVMITPTIFLTIIQQQKAYSTGEQTLGNGNSVTAFTDRSKNVQARVVLTPTPTLTLSRPRFMGVLVIV